MALSDETYSTKCFTKNCEYLLYKNREKPLKGLLVLNNKPNNSFSSCHDNETRLPN